MSEQLDKAIDLVYPNLNCGCWSSPDPTDYPCKRCIESSEAIVVALEAHFREVFAQKLEAEAWASSEYGNFKAAARFLRESDR